MELNMPRPLVVSLDHDLPARPEALSPDALSKVFGGCVGNGGLCTPSASDPRGNCCSSSCTAVDRRGQIFFCGGSAW